ncbi:unnamed protein product [Ilex paraguariensis]|uniref:BAH domain-containing protein n=1 Tax=Ilex paraguariensis TaxID=185542 RepID=A0ABC8UYZ7_9AQUA
MKELLFLFVVGSDLQHNRSFRPVGGLNRKVACELDVKPFTDVQLRKLGQHKKDFLWLGSPWMCGKRRRHYQSFHRNGVKISVHNFVYVLAEEDKQLVAYLDDMYEDSRGNKMVVVQWLHKIDEVGIALPHNYIDREIFFSLCLQDLSVECIDGLATVLSPQHYEKFLNVAAQNQLEPFVCHKQCDVDDIKPFDITQVKGYWNQEIFKYVSTASLLNCWPSTDGLEVERHLSDAVGIRPKKRLRRLRDCEHDPDSAKKQETKDACLDVQDLRVGFEIGSLKEQCSTASLCGKEAIKQKHPQYLTIGSQVEVLSQDSGIRGCWFRAQIIKRHKDRVKVRYQDIKDAADEANNLEEWILESRVAVPDEFCLRVHGRTTVRPSPPSNKSRFSWVVEIGTVVDAWWHDGWWEGIVVKKTSKDMLHLYFPGEKRESIFSSNDLRRSQEWLGNGWRNIEKRPELVTLIFSGLELKRSMPKLCDGKLDQGAVCSNRVQKDCLPVKDDSRSSNILVHSREDKVKELEVVRDLSKDVLLSQLRWKSSRKRGRGRNSAQKVLYSVSENKSSPEAQRMPTCENFFIPSSLKTDHDNCKYIENPMFSSSVVPSLTSLVMSR